MNLEVIHREPKIKRFETPLLFVHGTGHAAWCWDEHFLPFFAENGFDSFAVSLRGHGTSAGIEKLKWTSVADFAANVFQTASGLSKPPAVIGHSLGGLVVLKYLEEHAAPAGILVAPSPSEGMLRSALRLLVQNPLIFIEISLKQDFAVLFATPERVKKFLFSADADDVKITEYTRRIGRESFRANLEMLYNLPKPEKVKTQLLVLGAENDALIGPEKIKKTARDFNAECRIFPQIAHDMMLEKDWQTVAEFMIKWLEKKIQ